MCLTFVFGALLEFALVNYASRSDKHREKLKEKLKEQKKQWEVEHAAALEAVMAEQAEDGHSAFAMVSSWRARVMRRLKGAGTLGNLWTEGSVLFSGFPFSVCFSSFVVYSCVFITKTI